MNREQLALQRPLYNTILNAYGKCCDRNWDKMYWCIDLHDTLYPATYKDDAGEVQPYPEALELMKVLMSYPENVIILWSSLWAEDFKKHARILFPDMDITGRVFFNENPLESDTKYASFDKKFYFNVLLDDKAGFDPNIDLLTVKIAVEGFRRIAFRGEASTGVREVTKIPDMGIGRGMLTQETWAEHATVALSKVYKPDEVKVVVDWFYNIRGSVERDLIGSERVDAHLTFAWPRDGKHYSSVYASLMSRMWVYAPYIIEEAIKNGELK